MSPYAIERFRPGLLRGVADLRRSLFGNTLQATTAYFDWMYGENPYIEEPPLIVAVHDGAPVGMRGTLGTQWECPTFNGEHVLPSLTDTCIAPGHRDQGLYSELTDRILDQFAAQGHSHVLNMTPSAENFIASTVSPGGFTPVGEHGNLESRNPRYVRRRVGSVIRRLRVPITSNPFVHLDKMRPIPVPPSSGVSITADRNPRPIAMAELVARLTGDQRIRHVRDSRYFAWRYRNPLAHHRFVYAERGADLVGYAALQCAREAGAVDVADLEAADSPVRNALLDVIENGRFATSRIWSSTLAPDVVADLRKHGFSTPVKGDHYANRFILRPLNGDAAGDRWSIDGVDLRRLANWDLRAAVATTY